MLGRLKTVAEPSVRFYAAAIRSSASVNPKVMFSTETSKEAETSDKKPVSKAMKAYLQRAKEYDEFMLQQNVEFQIGKRHLANMMGEDPETFTQKDIDEAIEYLFPSGIYDKRARPFMRSPEQVFPAKKAAEFDETGRPHHFLFYTGKPNYYQLLHDAVEHIIQANKFENQMLKKGQQFDSNLALESSGFQWVDKTTLEKELVETLSDKDYEAFVNTMERLCELPYSYKSKDFIEKYRRPLMSQTKTTQAPKPMYDENGRAFITTYECLRKRARGSVTIRSPGNGKITINGQDITYFKDQQPREQVKITATPQSARTMDNKGFQDSTISVPNGRKLGRSVSVAPEVESFPLYKTTHHHNHNTAPVGLKWHRDDGEFMIEEDVPSDDFEYMECGKSPPADHTPNIYESFEDFTPRHELTVQICSDTIKMNLVDHMKVSSGRLHLLEDVESKKITQDNLKETYAHATKFEVNITFLWAAFMKRWDLLDGLLGLGAQITYYEPCQGLSALHLAAFSGCIPSTQFLLAQGCDVNARYKCYTPLHCAAFGDSPETAMILLNNGARVTALTSSPHNNDESVLHCAVRANAIACVRLFTAEGADVGQVEHSGMSPIHLAADLGHAQCLAAMLEACGNVNARTRGKENTPLHLAAEGGYLDCIVLLLDRAGDANAKNHRRQTPLHMASRAQAYDCVELLLRKGNADPNCADCDRRTPLHAALGKSARSYDTIEILINYGADVNARDQYGYTPLHIAALNELSQCVEVLIYHGADVTAKSKFGMTALGIITRKTPASLAMVTQKLDSAITLHHHPESSNREVELRLDFRSILQHCHPREISFLNTFVDEGQKEVLLHPLCSAFLYLKWEKIRKYYIARMLFCLIFVLSLSLYVLTALAHNCYNHGKNRNETQEDNVIELCEKKSMMGHMLRTNPFVIEMQWFVLVGITCCEILRKVYGIAGYPSVKQYLSHPENIIEWTVVISVFVISFIYTGRTYTWQNHIGAFAVLFGWTNLMLMIGQLPIFGSYVAMYTRVQGEFAKLLLAYSCLLIGFTISFCVIFPDSSTFANPFIGLITVLVMMTGELNLDILVDDDPEDPPFLLEISAQVTYILFLLFVTVILMNLLVGIAVHDIQGLQKTAGLSKLVRQTKLISYMELALFNGYLPRYLLNLLHWTALVSPKAYRVVLNVKPLNPREKRLPRDILKAAHEIAKKRKNYGHTISSNGSHGSSKKTFNNNTDQCSEIFEYNPLLQNKIEKSAEQIEYLCREVRELKQALVNNQKIIEQLMTHLVAQKNTSSC